MSLCRTVVEAQKSAESLPATNETAGRLSPQSVDKLVAETLMIAFPVIVGDEFGHGPTEMAFTERDHLVQAFLLDRADKALCIRIAVWRTERRLHESNASRREKVLNGGTPLPIPVADQDGTRAERSGNGVSQVAHRLDDERFIRVRR